MNTLIRLTGAVAALVLLNSKGMTETTYKMTTPIPPEITTPDNVPTQLGELTFADGVPTPETAQKVFDNLDHLRAVEVFLNGVPGASLVALRAGLREVGAVGSTVGVFESLMDSKSLFLTANTETIYFLN